jgi:hypothetical protein
VSSRCAPPQVARPPEEGRLAPCRLGAALDRVEELEKRTMEAIRAQCPKVKRLSSDAVLGPYD